MTATVHALASSALGAEYDIGDFVGAGWTTMAFRATHRASGRAVALKVLRQSNESVAGKRFLAELRFAQGVRHAVVEAPVDAGASAELAFYAVPFVEGESVRQHLDRDGRYPWPEAYRIVAQVAKGLQRVHECNLLHRNIHPGKIRVGPNAVVLTGVGVAYEPALTHTGADFSRVAYASLEQLSGERLDHRSDLFALGTVLYEMLAGESAGRGAGGREVIMNRVKGVQPPPPTVVNPALPAHADTIVMRAIAPERDGRYQWGGGLALDLEQALGGHFAG